MKTSRKVRLSITVLIICMTVGFLFLLFAYRGPAWKSLLVFIIYIFILGFLFISVRKLLKALEESEKDGEEKQ